MKNIVVLFLLSFITLQLTAQEAEISEKKKKKTERKIAFIQYKYESGDYETVIAEAKIFIKKNKETNLFLPELVKANLLQASAYKALFKFSDAVSSFKNAEVLLNKEAGENALLLSYIHLAGYLLESGNVIAASDYADKASALLKVTSSEKQKADIDLIKAKIIFRKGYLSEALTLLDQQLNYRLQSASSSFVDIKDAEGISPKIDLKKRKEKYADLLNTKSAVLLAKGMYQEAELAIKNNQEWIASQLGKQHSLYRKSIEKEAELALIRNNPGKASDIYIHAYVCQNFPESEQHKIHNLSRIITTSIESGQIIRSNNYLRRLQMYAFRNVGADDPFQVAYEYVEANKAFIEGNYTASLNRLDNIESDFKFLPEVHYWNLEIVELKAKVALKSGNVKMYKESLSKICSIEEKYFGSTAPAYHKKRLSLALYEIKFGKDFALAEDIMQKSYRGVIKKEIEKSSKENIIYLSAYADLFAKKDKLDSAFAKAKEASEITLSIYGEKSAEYALSFAQSTEYQILSGKYKEGFENLQKANGLSESIKQGELEIRQNVLVVLSRMYAMIGEFEKSKSLLAQAYKLTQSSKLTFSEKQLLSEAETSEQLGSLYLLSGDYSGSEKALKKAFSIKEVTLSADNPAMIHIYQELARLYLITGNYANAEVYLKKSIQITESVFGKNSLRYGQCLLIAADYYLSIGDYKKAEDAVMTADNIEIEKLGKTNLRRAEILSQLAFIRSKTGNYKTADLEKLYKEADNIIKSSLGASNPLSALLMEKQAELYIHAGKPEKAEPLLVEAEKYWNTKLGAENQNTAQIQMLKGEIAYNAGKYDLAEKSYKKSQQLFGNIFSESHKGFVDASGKLARVYYMKGDLQKSLDLMETIIPNYLNYTVNFFPSLSFREKSKFWNNMKEEFEFYDFLAFNSNTKNPQLTQKVYNNLISTKALLLSSNIKIREKILTSKDSVLIDYYNQWLAQKEYLTNVLALTKQQLNEQKIDPKSIESDIERLEKEVSLRSENFNTEEKKKRATWEDVKKSLKDNEYAVEIVRYRYFKKSFTDSVIYGALIINNKSAYPELVLLPNGNMMEKKYMKVYRNSAIFKVKDKTSYAAYWEPLAAKIPDGATIFLSGDGVYNQINVEMLCDNSGKYVLDKNQIVLVTNTKDNIGQPTEKIVSKKNTKNIKKEGNSTYILCGNPDFYTDNNSNNSGLASLPGAEQEVNEINKVLLVNGKNAIKFINKDVTEDTLKKLNNPMVFHIATHGYFKESVLTSEEDFASNPLLNSGLMLSGSGDILSNSENKYVNSKEGILTAYEATNLSFDYTELVVLSACETGRGEVQVGEGVYGLQRAFLIAGADAVIMSLFKVNDEVTQKLMVSFYNKWLKTGDKRTAFTEAKREIKKEYDIPLYWGSFIMIEGKPQKSVVVPPMAK